MIPSGDGTHQRVPSPTFRVMTPPWWGKQGPRTYGFPRRPVHPHSRGEQSPPAPTLGSSPPWWGKWGRYSPPDFGTRFIPTRVGKIVGVVAGEGHGFDGSTPLLGLGLSSSRRFGGVQVFGGRTRTAPKPPPARKPLPQLLRGQGETVQVRAVGLQPGPGAGSWPRNKQTPKPQKQLV